MKLSADEISALQAWVKAGSPYQKHWAFQRIVRPALPSSNDSEWGNNPIDAFVLQRLHERGLEPSPPASKQKLIRRISFDLTGLPPTAEQIDNFVSDEQLGSIERMVDYYLQQEAYGERMAVDWLDVSRYSDSYGYQVDRDRFVWPWRDWVIAAFNDNMPYDIFVTQQIAGDLLPNATDQEVLATTFGRLHPQKVEGGSVPEEFRTEYVADRNHTFGTAFLGLTLECCRCHDHKYDPLTQREYYQLFAFFNNIDEAGLYSYFTQSVPTPTLTLGSEQERQNLKEQKIQTEAAESSLKSLLESPEVENTFHAWRQADDVIRFRDNPIVRLDFDSTDQGSNQSVAGHIGQAVQLTGDDGIDTKVGNFRRWQPFSIALWLNAPKAEERAVVFHRSAAWTDAASRGYELLIEDGRLSASLVHFMPGNALTVQSINPLPLNEWTHVAMVYDGSSQAAGLQIFVNGKMMETKTVRDNLYKNITGGGGDNITIGQRFRDRGFTGGKVDEFKVFDRKLSRLEVLAVAADATAETDLRTLLPAGSDLSETLLRDYYRQNVNPEVQTELSAVLEQRKKLCELQDAIEEIMVMRELAERRPTHLLTRGAYDAPADEVRPMTPRFLPAMPESSPANRLGLAQWLTSRENPLFARVMVNRLWQQCFGQGLVRTPEDFGSQGQPPTHPLLLDWLAADFMENGWDIKRTLKLIVSSATYQQTSLASRELVQKDPNNYWLARAPRYRLPGEMIRDNALSISGLLVSKVGGPPVRPYEVTESFKPVNRDKGEGLYRRSLYTYWKRTAPAPVMMTLDASKRDVCSVKRERTASPLQSLVLLNDPQLIEASRTLAIKLLQNPEEASTDWIRSLFVLTTSRLPKEAETAILVRMYGEQFAHFSEHPKQTAEFLKVGETQVESKIAPARLAAATIVVSAMLNFDECVTKR